MASKTPLQTMSMFEHLDVLRKMLFRMICVVAALAIAIFCIKDEVFTLLLAPKEYNFITFRAIEQLIHAFGGSFSFEPYHVELINTELSGQFMAHISSSVYLALLLASPYLITEVFLFILPALYENEKRYSVHTAVTMYLLFAAGVLMNYFVLFPISFRFLGTYSVSNSVTNLVSLDSYMSTFTSLTFMMGLVFQLPVVCFFLAKIGILSAKLMSLYRKHALIAIMVVAAFITPPDIFTMFLVTLPLYLLYEVSIWVVSLSA